DDRLSLLYAARATAVLWGVGAVAATWWAVRALWADRLVMGGGVALALTLHPQFTFVTATVNNDAAVLGWGAALFALWAAGLRAQAEGRAGAPRPPARGGKLWRWGVSAGLITGL